MYEVGDVVQTHERVTGRVVEVIGDLLVCVMGDCGPDPVVLNVSEVARLLPSFKF